jgi:secreted PhoX family phosphatase
MSGTTRREFVRTAAVAAATLGTAGIALGRPRPARAIVVGPYGPLGAADALGVRLPAGFTARLVAQTDAVVSGSAYVWPPAPDGAGTISHPDGGWVLVQNSEDNGQRGGVSAIRFDASGVSVDAYRILGGTKWNCTGGITPWGTWLSCEEFRNGQIWECDPFRSSQGIVRPLLGTFAHEGAQVDPSTGFVYMTEDSYDGRLYRFRPSRRGNLTAGALEAASVGAGGAVTWLPTPADRPARAKGTTIFARGEGAWISRRVLYFATTGDDRVWALDLATNMLRVIYDGIADPTLPLHSPDNVTVHEPTGHVFVAEDGDDLQLVLLAPVGGGAYAASPFLQLVGHGGSEVAGPVFTPDGTRLYACSQRGTDGKTGQTFEITGPFATS